MRDYNEKTGDDVEKRQGGIQGDEERKKVSEGVTMMSQLGC